MANVENKSTTSVLDVIRQSLDVDSDGNVSFKSRTGRGSGAPVVIPGDQFDEFVDLMTGTRDNREALAKKQKEVETNEENSSESSTTTEE